MSSASDSANSGASTSPSLLVRLQARESDAWQRLADLYGPLVFHWGRRCQLSDEDAGDVMQEVFAAVATAIDSYQPERGRFRGWLWTITRNKIRDLHRKRERRPVTADDTAARHQLDNVTALVDQDLEEPTSAIEATRLFHRGLELVRGEFAERTWQAFWRAVVEEEDTASIADDLGISASAVRQSKSRVLRRLREELGDS